GTAPEAVLRHAGGSRPSHVRVLRPRRRLGPLQLPALPREQAARCVRVSRHPRPARVPRARRRSPAASQGGPRREAPRRIRRRERHGLRGEAAIIRPPEPHHAPRMTPEPAATEDAPRVAVIGAGAWGTTLALIVARAEPVLLLSHSVDTATRLAETRENQRRLPGIELPPGILITADPDAVRKASDLVILAVPSAHLRATVERVAAAIPPGADVLSVVKGLENETLLRMTEVIADAS